jgi:hypothetical protein
LLALLDLLEAGYNNSTVALRVVIGDNKGTQCLGLYLGHTVPWGYKYKDLDLQVGRVSSEIIKCGHEFCGTWTGE